MNTVFDEVKYLLMSVDKDLEHHKPELPGLRDYSWKSNCRAHIGKAIAELKEITKQAVPEELASPCDIDEYVPGGIEMLDDHLDAAQTDLTHALKRLSSALAAVLEAREVLTDDYFAEIKALRPYKYYDYESESK